MHDVLQVEGGPVVHGALGDGAEDHRDAHPDGDPGGERDPAALRRRRVRGPAGLLGGPLVGLFRSRGRLRLVRQHAGPGQQEQQREDGGRDREVGGQRGGDDVHAGGEQGGQAQAGAEGGVQPGHRGAPEADLQRGALGVHRDVQEADRDAVQGGDQQQDGEVRGEGEAGQDQAEDDRGDRGEGARAVPLHHRGDEREGRGRADPGGHQQQADPAVAELEVGLQGGQAGDPGRVLEAEEAEQRCDGQVRPQEVVAHAEHVHHSDSWVGEFETGGS